jgi:hypothetical protein
MMIGTYQGNMHHGLLVSIAVLLLPGLPFTLPVPVESAPTTPVPPQPAA